MKTIGRSVSTLSTAYFWNKLDSAILVPWTLSWNVYFPEFLFAMQSSICLSVYCYVFNSHCHFFLCGGLKYVQCQCYHKFFQHIPFLYQTLNNITVLKWDWTTLRHSDLIFVLTPVFKLRPYTFHNLHHFQYIPALTWTKNNRKLTISVMYPINNQFSCNHVLLGHRHSGWCTKQELLCIFPVTKWDTF